MAASPTPQELVEIGLEAVDTAEAMVLVQARSTANLRWANNTLTTNGEARELLATVIAFDRRPDGVAVGSVGGSAVTAEQIRELAAAACAVARDGLPARDSAPLVIGEADPDWAEPPVPTSIGVYADFAPGLGRAFGRASAEDRILYGFVDHERVTSYLGSSTGLRRRHVQPTGHFGCTAKNGELTNSAWVGGATRDFADVDAEAMEQQVATRLGWGHRRIDLPAGRYDTVLSPTSVADLTIYGYWSAGARAAIDGQSVYGGRNGARFGEQLARPGVTLWSDPQHPDLACLPFALTTSSGTDASVFDNGLPLQRTDWIADGRLSALLQTRETATLSGREVTPEIDNLILETADGAGTEADLIAGTERGLLVTCLWYIREVDPQSLLLTGLTRDGVYLIEDGQITGAVNNFRFNESPVDLLQRFSAASATVPSFSREWGDYFSRTATPALRVPDFNMSSVSQAL